MPENFFLYLVKEERKRESRRTLRGAGNEPATDRKLFALEEREGDRGRGSDHLASGAMKSTIGGCGKLHRVEGGKGQSGGQDENWVRVSNHQGLWGGSEWSHLTRGKQPGGKENVKLGGVGRTTELFLNLRLVRAFSTSWEKRGKEGAEVPKKRVPACRSGRGPIQVCGRGGEFIKNTDSELAQKRIIKEQGECEVKVKGKEKE